MALHKLLIGQLNRLDINPSIAPPQKQWREFIERVSKAYFEADQERYLHERSLEISSREVFDLNKKLENAQHIAKLGYWEMDLSNGHIFWSQELYKLHGIDPSKGAPHYKQLLEMIHPDDRQHMKNLLEKATKDENSHENKLRILHSNGEYKWFYTSFQHAKGEASSVLQGIALDITNQKKAEENIETLHQEIVRSALYAGMADIAASTLHNIGNVLNSAHVSVELLKEYTAKSKVLQLEKLVILLEEHRSHLLEFIYNNPQGRLIPEYFIAILQDINEEYGYVTREIETLDKSIAHISDIIVTQNDMSRSSGVIEPVFLPQLIDTALDMSAASFEKNQIRLEKMYEDTPTLFVDKVKVLQILINLIRNAKEAVIENTHIDRKRITIFTHLDKEKNKIIIKVKDNGIGILPENLTRIFSFGFTTKEKGHGFGLHMSALNAKKMGGSLIAESKGIEKGATFILTFPMVEANHYFT